MEATYLITDIGMDKDVVCVYICIHVHTYVILYVYVYVHIYVYMYGVCIYVILNIAICSNMNGIRGYRE